MLHADKSSGGSSLTAPTILPPSLSKSFGASSVASNATTSLSFNLSNAQRKFRNTTNVLDDSGGSIAAGNLIIQSPPGTGQELEWDVVSAGNGFFSFMNRASGIALDINGGVGAQAGFAVQEPSNSGTATQQWAIVPVL